MNGRLTVRCPAKINTRLEVLGRRPDGYHELDLDFISLALSDSLTIERAGEFSLEVLGADPSSVPVDDNLVLRAARLLQGHVGRPRLPGARMRLHKNIPAAAGMGGGSSDAAGALLGLDRLHDLGVASEDLARLALDLGSDVPYFLTGGACRGRGRGEILSALPEGPARPVVLIHPGWGLSTREVFEELARQRGAPGMLTGRKAGTNLEIEARQSGPELPRNDLLAAAISLAPELGRMLAAAREAAPGALVGLTGSGPTLFVLLEPGAAVADVQESLSRRLPAAGLTVTSTLGATEYQRTRFQS